MRRWAPVSGTTHSILQGAWQPARGCNARKCYRMLVNWLSEASFFLKVLNTSSSNVYLLWLTFSLELWVKKSKQWDIQRVRARAFLPEWGAYKNDGAVTLFWALQGECMGLGWGGRDFLKAEEEAFAQAWKRTGVCIALYQPPWRDPTLHRIVLCTRGDAWKCKFTSVLH